MARTADCGYRGRWTEFALEALGGTFSAISFVANLMSLIEYLCRFQTGNLLAREKPEGSHVAEARRSRGLIRD
jgi:hypothetical protein